MAENFYTQKEILEALAKATTFQPIQCEFIRKALAKGTADGCKSTFLRYKKPDLDPAAAEELWEKLVRSSANPCTSHLAAIVETAKITPSDAKTKENIMASLYSTDQEEIKAASSDLKGLTIAFNKLRRTKERYDLVEMAKAVMEIRSL